MAKSLPHIIVAHGSWHTPEAYAPLEEALEQQGYEVAIPSLPTMRADGMNKTLADDCQFFRSKIERLLSRGHDVIVVMHSYGGMLGAGSVHGLEKKEDGNAGIVGLVFMTCFIPGASGGLADGVGGALPPWIQFKTDEKSGIELCFVPKELGKTIFYEPYNKAEELSNRMNRQHSSTQYDPLPNGPGYKGWTMPMTYMICDEDKALLPQYQEIMIGNGEKNLDIKIDKFRTKGNHFPFLMMPEVCVEVLNRVAGKRHD